MIWARNLAILVIVIMSALAVNIVIKDGIAHGVGLDTFLAGVNNPWQMFINQDLVSGLILTIGWMVYRERGGRWLDTAAWVWMAIWWGNIVVAAYILVAVAQSGGDAIGFFVGRRSGVVMRHIWAAPGVVRRTLCGGIGVAVTAYLVWTLLSAASLLAAIGYVLAFPPIVLAAFLLASRRTALTVPAP